MMKYENKKPGCIGDYIAFLFCEIIPRLIAIIIIYNLCKEVINYKYHLYATFLIVAILQYKLSFIIYTLYVINYEDEDIFGEDEIYYKLAEMSFDKYTGIYRYENSFVVKSILSERKVNALADQYGASIMAGHCRSMLHPSMKSEHKDYYNRLLVVHNKKMVKNE